MYMKKKIYMKPAIEVCMTDTELELLAGSLTDVITEGLDEEGITLGEDDYIEGNVWEETW